MPESVAAVALDRRRRLGWKGGALAAFLAGMLLTGANCRRSSTATDAAKTSPGAELAPPERAGIEFVDVARERGMAFVWPTQPRPMRTLESFGCGCAAGDYDGDGRLDLTVTNFQKKGFSLFRDEGSGFFIDVGKPTDIAWATHDRLGFGAKWIDIDGYARDEVWVAEVSPASSYLSSSDPRIHWGLGRFERLEKLVIRWPSGEKQIFENVSADQFLQITAGQCITQVAPPTGYPAATGLVPVER